MSDRASMVGLLALGAGVALGCAAGTCSGSDTADTELGDCGYYRNPEPDTGLFYVVESPNPDLIGASVQVDWQFVILDYDHSSGAHVTVEWDSAGSIYVDTWPGP